MYPENTFTPQTHHADQAAPMLDRVADRASALSQRGSEALREGSQQLRERAHRASDSTINYIKDEPVKAVLFAAAAGALLTVLLRAFGGSRQYR